MALFFSIFIIAAAPVSAAYQPDLLVRLASEGDPAYVGDGLFESSALLQSKSQPAFAGSSASFRMLLKNAGDLPDSFLLRGTGSGAGFTVRVIDDAGVDRSAAIAGAGFATRVMAPGESLPLLVQVTPAAFQLGASFRVVMEAASAADQAKMDQVKTETISCGSSAALTVTTPPDGSGSPGSQVNYPYSVTNVGSGANNINITQTSPAGWQSAIYADDGAGGGIAGDGVRQPGENNLAPLTATLAPGESSRFFVAVTIPAAASDGVRGDTRLTVVGEGASASDLVTTSATAPVVSLAESVRNLTRGGAFAASADALPGDTLEYRMSVTNSGSAAAPSVVLASPVPANTSCLADSLWIGTSATGEGSPCALATCGWVRESGGSVLAHLGQGASAAAGGSLAAGKTLHVYFRVQVE